MNGSFSAGEALYPISAHARIDRALRLLRNLPAREWVGAMWPGTVLLALTVALYFLERVEGVRSLRPVFAVLFASAFVVRAIVLSRWSGRRVAALLAAQGVPAVHGSTQAIVRAAFWSGFDLWLWLWLLVLAIYIEPWLVVLVLPTFCLRSALLPSFFASADGSEQETGFSLIRTAMEESDGQRTAGVLAELYLLLGALGLAFNLGALLVAVLGLGQDMLGLDLSFVRAFLSPRNYFALLVLGGVALVCVEPVRALLSALLYVETRLSRDGLALRVLVDKVVSPAARDARRISLSLCFCLALLTPAAHAQESSTDWTVKTCDDVCERARAADESVNRRVDTILKDRVFTEFPDERWDAQQRGLASLIERFSRWLSELTREKQARAERPSSLSLPGATLFVVLALLLAFAAWLVFGQKPVHETKAKAQLAQADPWSRTADEHLQDALRQRDADLTQALRSLYLATLVGLARRGHLTLAKERTNGQYLQELKGPDERAFFSALTRIFDLAQYGRQKPNQEDFERCLSLAERLVGSGRNV